MENTDHTNNEHRLTQLLSIAEECETLDRLKQLVDSGRIFTAYNGFEPSGRIHIAQALITVMNTNNIIECGGQMIIYIADWFAKMNLKMNGDINKIRELGRYFIEVFKACGINLDGTRFIWASEFIASNPSYIERMLDIAEFSTISRVKRCCQIMGRNESDCLKASQIFYPCMQAADVFELVPEGIDICQLGIDQRKVNMLAIEYANDRGLKIPISLSHHMLMSLSGPKKKMSKSDPQGAIFMDDTEQEVSEKISRAYCTDETFDNPIFEYIKYLLLRWFGTLNLCGKIYTDIESIQEDFSSMNKRELKTDVANYINTIIDLVREHFKKPELSELLSNVKSYQQPSK
ncbi:tyrosyl-tRNA synthetase [Acanthamoeba castellanii mimivirus]|uniref:Tyrosine--tRNA ligase n=5 Tax=Mimivirus TaxID=315393 RepID=SYY_MIMIV|nr:tyrosyl-tRNA synthetase [Acanthamoeba polyphaga mimivirus]Q5UPJ7.1 RecName: Full=Tyrosine--tRNA ligase; AltName: Full=Tyrosyl-tRNA synthetase; Short=TyrRS [Acanthamoeba polyphaga mimivirus]AHJ39909.2 tyrosyl-tRNA synthetase [Samba virus]ALR83635.1 tyrosyl-tRNA synthetase [Niemeyer virus]AMZ02572.1 tyrosyl-tRNA synthetase [Mimivirus Bombay]BAV61209.1 tyrosyl-tRNA synthetase [Acanthamoeba castellanii mimivirus]AAV50399.1 tyrosyl-tRNA synthetase [Acanthamoeba polyphaga mimivirus]